MRTPIFCVLLSLLLLVSGSSGQNDKPGVNPSGPFTPREAQTTFKIAKGFVIELVASEPEVVDPVALAFDERGRLFVAEMHAYPNDGVGTGIVVSGKIKVLEDRDNDGFFEKSTVFADKLRLPNSVMPSRGGLIVSNAPEIVYFEDTDNDGKADKKRVLYSGFDVANIQQMVNGLQWGIDNWIYSLGGGKGSIKSAEKPDQAVVELRGRGIRFHLDKPGSLEPTSSGGQFGLASDDWGNWFVNTNSQHLRHVVLPDHYLRRNPDLPVSAVTLDISDHGPACKVHRLSPFESWRVERTTRRKDGPTSKNFSPTELVPGGFVTSGCCPVVYTANLFPEAYRGNTFICDPANNLVHRDTLTPSGATFLARRGDEDSEFLASTDNWFRPVFATVGPDGALYIADFYREIIETPLSLPEDIKKRWNLNSRGKGRIWRIRPEGKYQPVRVTLDQASGEELVKHLEHRNRWWRINAQRLLVERQDKSVVPALEKLARESDYMPGVVHALWTLRGLGAFHPRLAIRLTQENEPFVRVHALRLAEDYLKAQAGDNDPSFDKAPFRELANDPTPQVRFQAAFSLAEFPASLFAILKRDLADPWIPTAVLSSINTPQKAAAQLTLFTVEATNKGDVHPAYPKLFNRLGYLIGTRGQEQELGVAFTVLGRLEKLPRLQASLLGGLGQGLPNQKLTMDALLKKDSFRPGRFWDDFVQGVSKRARTDNANLEDREEAMRLLAFVPFDAAAPILTPQLSPNQPQAIQLAAIQTLGQHLQPRVAETLLDAWPSFSPGLRREVLEVVFARPERVRTLLDRIEQKKIQPSQLEPAKLVLLKNYPDAKLRADAVKLLASQIAPARQKVVEAYQSALDLKGDMQRGQALFKKTCATCHRLDNVGVEVGADLLSVLPNKTPERLLIDILDPSREVDPRFIEYLVTTSSGKVMTGLIASETAASITLRRAEKAEESVLRSQIDAIQSTAKSLMPEGLEMQLRPQDAADVIAYLMSFARKK